MKIRNVVKVMNFHSLLRVDTARKNAEKYFEYEREITDFADNILNNRNLILDKKILKLNKEDKPLNVYIGNDLGFCGNFNTNVNDLAKADANVDKIVIGKKITNEKQNVILSMTKDEYPNKIGEIEDILYDAILNAKYSEVNIIYNHYYNISKIELRKKKILPIENIKEEEIQRKKQHLEDFAIEGDINSILRNIIVLYLSYEIKIATENSFASENIMRQTITKESLKKLDEIEEANLRKEIKVIKNNKFKKVRSMYYSALARERYYLYKSNDYLNENEDENEN